jgi:effector-binding domain-containing protein
MKVSNPAKGARATIAALLFLVLPSIAWAQTTPTPAPTATPSPSPSPSAPATPTPTPTTPEAEGAGAGQTVDLVSKPVAFLEAKATRDEVYASILASFKTIRDEVAKAGLKTTDHPMAVFLEADDDGFKYRAEIPLEAAPDGKTQLSDAVKLGMSPVGKAMRFEHRGEYDEIDSTYDAITAYLDEKNIDAQEVFVEQYLNEPKTSDDPNLQVDIFVLLK